MQPGIMDSASCGRSPTPMTGPTRWVLALAWEPPVSFRGNPIGFAWEAPRHLSSGAHVPDHLGIRPHEAPPSAAPSGGERAGQHNPPQVSVVFRVRRCWAENGTGGKGRKWDLVGSRPLHPLPTCCPRLPSGLHRLVFVIGPWADLWALEERGGSRGRKSPAWLPSGYL